MSALACPTNKLRVELKGMARFGKPVGVVCLNWLCCAQTVTRSGPSRHTKVVPAACVLEALRAQAEASRSAHEPPDFHGDEVSFPW